MRARGWRRTAVGRRRAVRLASPWAVTAAAVAFVSSPLGAQVADGTAADSARAPLLVAATRVPPPAVAFLFPAGPTPDPGGPEEEVRENKDEWGVTRRPGVAVAEIFAINLLAWGLNHWGRGAEFTHVYPRTWWDNIRAGFEYDINLFQVNVIEHPFHGSLYFNAARTNGIGFWSAAPLTAAGSLMWECCAERHPMALNDVVYTTLGGIALGEATYRLSSAILDNEAAGAGRLGREAGAFLVNPVRGVNRLLSGRAGSVRPNPADPDARTPWPFALELAAGFRAVGRTGSLSEPSEGAVLELRVDYGSPFEGRRGRAYDVFELDLSLVTADRHVLEGLSIRGNLLNRDLRRGGRSDHVFGLVQEFEFDNTEAYQFANQNLGARLDSRWSLGNGGAVRTRLQGGWLVMGTLDASFAFVGPAPEPETLRYHDYGTGLDGYVAAEARVGGWEAAASWRVSWMGALNATERNGAGARHLIQQGAVRARVPLGRDLSLGSELSVFLRNSDFENAAIEPVRLTVPELRVFGVWSPDGRR